MSEVYGTASTPQRRNARTTPPSVGTFSSIVVSPRASPKPSPRCGKGDGSITVEVASSPSGSLQQSPDAKQDGERLRWRRGPLIGEGSYGKVFVGMNEATGQMLAIKVINFCSNDKRVTQRLVALQREIKVMRNLDHSNIVRYVCSQRVGASIHIFMEYVPGGSLASLLKQFGALGENTVCMYTRDICEVLQYLHSNGVIHRDVKAANVLVTVNGVLKLTDFGSAAHIKDATGGCTAGTSYWMAPEVIMHDLSSFPSDIWSLGCTVLEMLTARNPFYHIAQQEFVIMRYIGGQQGPVTLPEGLEISQECTDFLLRQCLIAKPEDRATAEDLLNHIFLQLVVDGYDDEATSACEESGLSQTQYDGSPAWSRYTQSQCNSPANGNHLGYAYTHNLRPVSPRSPRSPRKRHLYSAAALPIYEASVRESAAPPAEDGEFSSGRTTVTEANSSVASRPCPPRKINRHCASQLPTIKVVAENESEMTLPVGCSSVSTTPRADRSRIGRAQAMHLVDGCLKPCLESPATSMRASARMEWSARAFSPRGGGSSPKAQRLPEYSLRLSSPHGMRMELSTGRYPAHLSPPVRMEGSMPSPRNYAGSEAETEYSSSRGPVPSGSASGSIPSAQRSLSASTSDEAASSQEFVINMLRMHIEEHGEVSGVCSLEDEPTDTEIGGSQMRILRVGRTNITRMSAMQCSCVLVLCLIIILLTAVLLTRL